MNSYIIYVILILDNVRTLFFICSMISVVILVAISIGLLDTDLGIAAEIKAKKALKKAFIGACIFIILLTFTPSTKQAIIMMATPKVINNEQIQTISKDALDLLEQYIKKAKEKDE